jgi:hypothetical protein
MTTIAKPVTTDPDQILVAQIWAELYPIFAARSRHETVWKALAGLTEHEAFRIDDDAEQVLTKHIKALRGAEYGQGVVDATRRIIAP